MTEDTENYWQARANDIAAWLPYATREALMAFAWRQFQRAEVATFHIVDERRRAELLAQREASYAVSDALDWSAQARQPSHDELARRRSVVA